MKSRDTVKEDIEWTLKPPSCSVPASPWASALSAPASAWACCSARPTRASPASPRSSGDIRTNMFIGIGVTEAVALYAFVVALILIFVA